MSYLGPDQEGIVEIKRYVFPVEALEWLHKALDAGEWSWKQTGYPSTHVVEIGPLPLVTDEEFEEMTEDDTEIM